jgi:chromosome segregation ATPase
MAQRHDQDSETDRDTERSGFQALDENSNSDEATFSGPVQQPLRQYTQDCIQIIEDQVQYLKAAVKDMPNINIDDLKNEVQDLEQRKDKATTKLHGLERRRIQVEAEVRHLEQRKRETMAEMRILEAKLEKFTMAARHTRMPKYCQNCYSADKCEKQECQFTHPAQRLYYGTAINTLKDFISANQRGQEEDGGM